MHDENATTSELRVRAYSQAGGANPNEDVSVANDCARIYGVIDGVSALVPYKDEAGLTGGCIAGRLLARELSAERPDIDLKAAVLQANAALRRRMQEAGIDVASKGSLWGAVFAFVKVYDKHVEFVQSGDCMLLARYQDGSVRVLTRNQVAGFDRITLEAKMGMTGSGTMSDSDIAAAMRPLYEANRNLANTLNGYSVMNGDPELEHFMESGRISRAGLRKLYAATDGLFHFFENDDDPRKWERFATRLDELSIETYIARLTAEEECDPTCRQYPRHKKSDDKTAVVLELDAR